jgi:hypothetical protein
MLALKASKTYQKKGISCQENIKIWGFVLAVEAGNDVGIQVKNNRRITIAVVKQEDPAN